MTSVNFRSQAWDNFSKWFDCSNPVEGDFWGTEHWERVQVTKGDQVFDSYLDNSTGKLYGYRGCCWFPLRKGEYQEMDPEPELVLKRVKAVGFILFSPIYVTGVELYHIIRIIPKITYLAARIFYDKAMIAILESRELKSGSRLDRYKNHLSQNGTSWKSLARERCLEIIEEVGYCLSSVLLSPVWIGGMVVSALIIFPDPLNGTKGLHSFEDRLWHHVGMGKSVAQILPLPWLNYLDEDNPSLEGFVTSGAYKLPGYSAVPCMWPVGEIHEYDSVKRSGSGNPPVNPLLFMGTRA